MQNSNQTEGIMERVHPGRTQTNGDVVFMIELHENVSATGLIELERQLRAVLAEGADRLLHRSFVSLKNKNTAFVAFSGSLSDHELELALIILTSRLCTSGYLSAAPALPDPIRYEE